MRHHLEGRPRTPGSRLREMTQAEVMMLREDLGVELLADADERAEQIDKLARGL